MGERMGERMGKQGEAGEEQGAGRERRGLLNLLTAGEGLKFDGVAGFLVEGQDSADVGDGLAATEVA